jgi:hypothetical protein
MPIPPLPAGIAALRTTPPGPSGLPEQPPYVFNNLCTCGAALDALREEGRPARYEDHSTTATCPAVDCTDCYPHDGDPCPTCGRSSTGLSDGS